MSLYGLLPDGDGVDLIVLYPSDAGWISQSARHARVVARSTAPGALEALEPVVAALEGVSCALWERFAQIDNTRFWDWLRTMANLLLHHPPEQMPQMPDPDLEWIARLGRALEDLGDGAMSDAVRAEVDAEFDAIESALLGDLDGRAAQARFAERRRPDPRQVEAAHHVLAAEALSDGSLRGLARVEPASGAVAVATWLAAAAALWADSAQRDAAEAVADVPLPQPAHGPIVRRVMADIAGDPDALASVVEQELHTAGPMRVLCALSEAYFGLRSAIVTMAQRQPDDSVCLGGRVCIPGTADDSTERLIGRELAARSGAHGS